MAKPSPSREALLSFAHLGLAGGLSCRTDKDGGWFWELRQTLQCAGSRTHMHTAKPGGKGKEKSSSLLPNTNRRQGGVGGARQVQLASHPGSGSPRATACLSFLPSKTLDVTSTVRGSWVPISQHGPRSRLGRSLSPLSTQKSRH